MPSSGKRRVNPLLDGLEEDAAASAVLTPADDAFWTPSPSSDVAFDRFLDERVSRAESSNRFETKENRDRKIAFFNALREIPGQREAYGNYRAPGAETVVPTSSLLPSELPGDDSRQEPVVPDGELAAQRAQSRKATLESSLDDIASGRMFGRGADVPRQGPDKKSLDWKDNVVSAWRDRLGGEVVEDLARVSGTLSPGAAELRRRDAVRDAAFREYMEQELRRGGFEGMSADKRIAVMENLVPAAGETLRAGSETFTPEEFGEHLERYARDMEHLERFAEDARYRNDWLLQHTGLTEERYRNKVADELEGRLNEIERKLPRPGGGNSLRGGYAAIGRAINEKPSSEAPAVREWLTKARDVVNTLRKDSFGSGLRDGFDLGSVLTAGFKGLGDNANLIRALNAASRGEKLTSSQQALVDAWSTQQEAEDAINLLGGRSLGAGIGAGFSESLEFMTGILATSPAANAATAGIRKAATSAAARSAARAVAREATKKGWKSAISEGLSKGAVRLSESVVGAAARTPLTGQLYAGYTDKRLGQFSVEERPDDDGIEKTIRKAPRGAWKDALEAFLETAMEYQSEDVGQWIGAGANALSRRVAQSRLGTLMGLKNFSGAKRNAALQWFKENAKITNFAGEVLSEAYGDAMVNLFEGNRQGWREMMTKDYWWTLGGVSALLSGPAGALGVPAQIRQARAVSGLSRLERKALASIENPELKDRMVKIAAMENITERSRELAKLDWKSKEITEADAVHVLDFINARTKLDALQGSETEDRRLTRFIPVLETLDQLQYRGAEGKAPTGEMMYAADNSGNGYIVLSGDPASDGMLTVYDPVKKSRLEVPASDISGWETKGVSDVVAEEYAMMFRVEANQEKLDNLFSRVREAAEAGVRDEALADMLLSEGVHVFRPGDEATLLDGQKVLVDSFSKGDYEVILENGEKVSAGLNEVLQPDAEAARAQQAAAQTQDAVAEYAVSETVPDEVRQAGEQAETMVREAVVSVRNADDDIVYTVDVEGSDEPVNILRGVSLVYDPQTGAVDVPATLRRAQEQGLPETAAIRHADGKPGMVHISELQTVLEAADSEEIVRETRVAAEQQAAAIQQQSMAEQDAEGRITTERVEAGDIVGPVGEESVPEAVGSDGNTAPVVADETEAPEKAQEQVVGPEIPRQKNGQPDFNAMPADMLAVELSAAVGHDKAVERLQVARGVNAKSLDKLRKSLDGMGDLNKAMAVEQQIAAMQQEDARLAGALEQLGAVEESVTGKAPAENFSKEIERLFPEGLPNVRARVLADIARGQRFVWNDSPDGTKRGVATELGFTGNESERRARFGMLGSEATGAKHVSSYVHDLWEDSNGYALDMDDAALRDEVIDVLLATPSRASAMAQLRDMAARHAEDQAAMEAYEAQRNGDMKQGPEAPQPGANDVPFSVMSEAAPAPAGVTPERWNVIVDQLRRVIGAENVVTDPEAVRAAYERIMGHGMEIRRRQVADINERFNEQLERWENGDMAANEYVDVGMPLGVMRSFMPDIPIVLRQKVLTKSNKKHGLGISALRNLPQALSEPVFVFRSRENTIGVLTELQNDEGQNLFVAVELAAHKRMGHQVLEINDVLSIHGREIRNIIEPIAENNTLQWVDKEKGLRWLSSAKSNSQAIANEVLITAVKIVTNFENPKIKPENIVPQDEKTRYFRTPEGEVYGFTAGGKIYLDSERMNAATPMHEYTELWSQIVAREKPELWARGVELMKQTEVWKQVNADPNYKRLPEDLRASETLSRVAAGLFEEKQAGITDDKGLFDRFRDWLREFWNALKATFSKWTQKRLEDLSADDFARMPLRDFVEGIDLKKYVQERNFAREVEAEKSLIRETAQADGTYLKAPNGQPSKLTADQWETVRTRQFKEWFGDWENDPDNASKVVDENGEPLVVYHGTDSLFNTFLKSRRGIWFTPNFDRAKSYATARTGDRNMDVVVPAFLNLKNPDSKEYDDDFIPFNKRGHDGWISRFNAPGEDGSIFTVVVANPNQIKSATENIGAFDPANPDIRFNREFTERRVTTLEKLENKRDALIADRGNIANFDERLAAVDAEIEAYMQSDPVAETFGKDGGAGDAHLQAVEDAVYDIVRKEGVDGVQVDVVRSADDLLEYARGHNWHPEDIQEIGQGILKPGYYGDGEITILASLIKNRKTVAGVFWHERTHGITDKLRAPEQLTQAAEEAGAELLDAALADRGYSTGHHSMERMADEYVSRGVEILAKKGMLDDYLAIPEAGIEPIEAHLTERNVPDMLRGFIIDSCKYIKNQKYGTEERILLRAGDNGGSTALSGDEARLRTDDRASVEADEGTDGGGDVALRRGFSGAERVSAAERDEGGVRAADEVGVHPTRGGYLASASASKLTKQQQLIADVEAAVGDLRNDLATTIRNFMPQVGTLREALAEESGDTAAGEQLSAFESAGDRAAAVGALREMRQTLIDRDIRRKEEDARRRAERREYHEKVLNLYSRLTETDVEPDKLPQSVTSYIKTLVTPELMEVMGIRDFHSIATDIETALQQDKIQKTFAEYRKQRAHYRDIQQTETDPALLESGRRAMEAAARTFADRVLASRPMQRIMDAVADMDLRLAKNRFDDLLHLKVEGLNASGVNTAKSVDENTRVFFKLLRDNLGLTEAQLQAKIEKLQDGNAVNPLVNFDGVMLHAMYRACLEEEDNIDDLKSRLRKYSRESVRLYHVITGRSKAISDALREEARANRAAARRAIDATRAALVAAKSHLAGNYANLNQHLTSKLETGKTLFSDAEEARKRHRKHLISEAVKAVNPEPGSETLNADFPTGNRFVKGLASPFASFEGMLQTVSINDPGRSGFLTQHFMLGRDGWAEANGQYQQRRSEILSGILAAFDRLVHIHKNSDTDDLFRYFGERLSDRDGNPVILETTSPEGSYYKSRSIVVTRGKALLWIAWGRQSDLMPRLENIGLDREKLETLRSMLSKEDLAFLDWIQLELLPELLKERYNPVYRRMFGVDMDSTTWYFPFVANKNMVRQEVDMSQIEADGLPATITGSIIRRRHTMIEPDLDVDLMGVLTNHLGEMEHWAAFAPFISDINTLLSSPTFRNALESQQKGRYSAFKKVCFIAADAYRKFQPDPSEQFLTTLEKTCASAKIAWRGFTALKQVLSGVMFRTYTSDARFQKIVTRHLWDIATWRKDWTWCMENLPSFRERWESRYAGDERLALKSPSRGILSQWLFDHRRMQKARRWFLRSFMYMNALVDACVCARGARAVYLFEIERLQELGLDAGEADRQAKILAAIAMNTTQQSSEGAYMSVLQSDRTYMSATLSIFNNSNFSYGRIAQQAFKVLTMSKARRGEVLEARKRYWISRGSDEAQAAARAREDMQRLMRDARLKLLLAGYLGNLIWNLFPPVMTAFVGGFNRDRDNRDSSYWRTWWNTLRNEVSWSTFVTPVFRNFAGGSQAEGVVNGFDLSLSMALQDYEKLKKELSDVVNDFSPALALHLLNKVGALGLGVDFDTFVNMYQGAHKIFTRHETAAGIFQLLNSPKAILAAAEHSPGRGETDREYLERMAYAEGIAEEEMKRIETVPSYRLDDSGRKVLRKMKKWERNYLAYRQASALGMSWERNKFGDVVIPELEQLDKDYAAAVKRTGLTRSGEPVEELKRNWDSLGRKEKDLTVDIIGRVKAIHYSEQALERNVVFGDEYREQMKALIELKQEVTALVENNLFDRPSAEPSYAEARKGA